MAGKNIICFGDSITYGQGAQRGEDFPSLLSGMLGRVVINAGVPGNTTSDGLKRLKEDVLRKDPYLVLVELGVNDYFQNIPAGETIRNLEQIVTEIQTTGAKVAICDLSADRSLGKQCDMYHRQLKELAEKTGSIFIPRLMRGIIQEPSLRVDSFHPNTRGYNIIAERIYSAIKQEV